MADGIVFYKETEFKDTEIGRIPKEWEVVNLEGACVEITDGSHWSPKQVERSEYRIATVANLRETYIDIDSCKFISEEDYKCLVKEGDVPRKDDMLFSKDGTVGITFTFKQDSYKIGLLSSIAIIRPNHELLFSDFGAYALKSPNILMQITGWKTGTALRRIILDNLKRLKIMLPPLHEQRKIASILSTVDEAIQKTDDIIAKTERLKKGLMQELLTRGIGHKEFKFTKELDCKIPKEWSVVKLREIGENKDSIVAGPFGSNLKVKDYTTEGVPIIRLQNIERNKFIDENIKYTSPEKAKELSYHSFQPGDLVLAKLGDPIGKTCIVPSSIGKGIVVADVVRIRLSPKKVINKFIEYMLNSNICYEQLRKEIIGTTRPRTNITQIRNLKLPLPSFQEQQKIAEILSTVDEKLETLKLEKAKLERIKQWFMGDLLSGRIRVRVA